MFSFWQQDAFLGPADVVIVGAGFVGLWCAYELKTRQPQLKITVLEREPFPGGASVRNAGFACFGSPGEMLADAASMGEAAMWQTVALRYSGIRRLRQVLGDEAIDYDPCGGYESFTTETTFAPVQDKLAWLNKGMQEITGQQDVFTIEDAHLPYLGLKNFEHLVANRLEGGLHSGKTLQTLLQKVSSLGVLVLFGCQVNDWEPSGSSLQVQATATESFTLTTGRLLFATNASLLHSTPGSTTTVQPTRGQILLTEPIKGLAIRGTFHFDEGFYYWRNVGNRILLGGARNTSFTTENTFEQATSTVIQQALEAFLHRHVQLPASLPIAHRWAGIMGFTDSKKPLVTLLEANIWRIVACNGMGVALAPAIAELVTEQLLA